MSEWKTMWARIWAALLRRPAAFKITPKTGKMALEGQPVRLISTWDWQFFAFVFGALLTLAYGVMDSAPCLYSPWCARRFSPWITVGFKVLVFGALAWLTLRCWWFKARVVRLLDGITKRST